MPPPNDTGFLSFANWLGLNQQSLDELEAQAAQRALGIADKAQGALNESYRAAMGSAQSGTGPTALSGQASYGDFLRLQREAQMARRPTDGMSARELAGRGAMPGPALPDLAAVRDRLQDNVSQFTTGRANDRRIAAEMARNQKAERDAQASKFAESEKALGPDWANREANRRRSIAIERSYDEAAKNGGFRVIPREESDEWTR